MTMGNGGIFGVPKGSRRKRGGLFDPQLETPDSVEMAPPLGSDFEQDEQKKGLLSYWQGGDKFTWKDAGAGLLAVVGDAFARENDDEGSAVSNLTGGRVKAIAEAKAAAEQQRVMAAFRNKGMDEDDITIAMLNPEAFGTQAASRFNERITDKAGNRVELGPKGPRTIYTDNSPELMSVPNVGVFAMNRQTGQAFGNSEPPPQAVADLRSNPGLAAQFDEAYGAGASRRYLGGGVGNGTGGFRNR